MFKRETKVIAYVVICLTLVVTYTNKNGHEISGDDVITNSACLEPMDDSDASLMTDCTYFLNILNRGSLPASYRLVLYNNVEDLPLGKEFVDHNLIRIGLRKGTEMKLDNFKTDYLINYAHTPETAEETGQSKIRYVLDEGVLESQKDISYSVQAWIDEDLATHGTIGKYVYLKLEVTGVVSEDAPLTNDSNSGAPIS